MTAQWEWSDLWPRYERNPDIFPKELIADLPRFLSQQSTKVQLEILRGAPDEIIKPLMNYLTFDAQIRLLYNK